MHQQDSSSFYVRVPARVLACLRAGEITFQPLRGGKISLRYFYPIKNWSANHHLLEDVISF
ncbi:MAG: hypothetical protein DSM106950_30150 [Stigonema ocellatum SAG 48.90 = DSM 106950]|nr:hypothetical protein [Stigonema ocellatum SAG 48.90 = DSM 106950]